MKRVLLSVFILTMVLTVVSCKSSINTSSTKPIYEILTQQDDGGASIRFFEILKEEREIKMLQNDELLKNKISANDIQVANFVILNMGEKTTPGHKITVDKVEETPGSIIITTKDLEPKTKIPEEREVFYYPYTIVRVNSKKEIVVQ